MAETVEHQQPLSGTAFTRFFLRRYLADDHEADEISASLDLHTLRFRDRELESKYREALERVARRRNRRLFRICAVIASLQLVWFWVSKTAAQRVASYWAEFAVSAVALFVLYLMAFVPRLQGSRWSIYALAVMCLFAITLGLFVADLLGLPPARPSTWWDGTIPPLVFLQIISLCFVTAEFKHVFIASTGYAFVHGVIFFTAQRSRASLGAWIALTFFVLIFNTIMMAYRKETYYRRIFWYQLALAAGTVERKKVVDRTFLEHAQMLTLPSADDLHTTIAVSTEALPPTTVPVSEKFGARVQRSLRKFLLIHEDPETECAFGEFITVQSVGHMTLSVTLSALVLIGNIIVLELRADTHHLLGDVIVRGGVIPMLMLIYVQVRRWLITRTSATRLAKICTTILIAVIVLFSLIAMTLRLQDEAGWAGESIYHMLIVQTAFAAATVYGLRMRDFVPVALAYFVIALPLSMRFRYTQNNILLGNCGVFLVTAWFLRHYERSLFLYFSLLRRRQQKKNIKEEPNTAPSAPGVLQTAFLDGVLIENDNEHRETNLAMTKPVQKGKTGAKNGALRAMTINSANTVEHTVAPIASFAERIADLGAQTAVSSSLFHDLPSAVSDEEANAGR